MKKYGIIPNRWLRPIGDPESGQALIEMAMTGSILVCCLLGVVEFGQITYASIEVANAAKGGIQYGAQNGGTAADSSGIQTAASAAAPDLTINASASPSCVCSDGSASTCALGDCVNSHIEETLTVNTTATIKPIIRLPGFGPTFTLHGQAIQRCLQ
jgi:Flp pilus assembly protein TadG